MKWVYLLDTNILSELTRPRPQDSVVTALEQNAGSCATSSITWCEINYGVQRLPVGKRRAELERFLNNLAGLPVLPYDEKAAALHAAIRVELDVAGKPISFADGQIAAVAQAHGLILVTRNTADFQNYPGIRLENWFICS